GLEKSAPLAVVHETGASPAVDRSVVERRARRRGRRVNVHGASGKRDDERLWVRDVEIAHADLRAPTAAAHGAALANADVRLAGRDLVDVAERLGRDGTARARDFAVLLHGAREAVAGGDRFHVVHDEIAAGPPILPIDEAEFSIAERHVFRFARLVDRVTEARDALAAPDDAVALRTEDQLLRVVDALDLPEITRPSLVEIGAPDGVMLAADPAHAIRTHGHRCERLHLHESGLELRAREHSLFREGARHASGRLDVGDLARAERRLCGGDRVNDERDVAEQDVRAADEPDDPSRRALTEEGK